MIKFDNERVVHPDEYVPFDHDVVLLLFLLDVLLLEDLHGIDLLALFSFFFDKHNFGIGSLPNDGKHIEVVKCELLLGLVH